MPALNNCLFYNEDILARTAKGLYNSQQAGNINSRKLVYNDKKTAAGTTTSGQQQQEKSTLGTIKTGAGTTMTSTTIGKQQDTSTARNQSMMMEK